MANPNLARIAAQDIEAERPDIHILNFKADDVEIAVLASLKPTHSVAIGASKLKGATSKILRRMAPSPSCAKLVGEGYFACTAGPPTFEELNRYLDRQGHHHGYDSRAHPPLYVRSWKDPGEIGALRGVHSWTSVRWHLVFSTWDRKGVFTAAAAKAIVDC